jgi:hypothetical protein
MRYYVFAYSTYYPEGGMNDCVLKTERRGDAIVRAVFERDHNFNNASVWDTVDQKFVSLPEEQ